MSSAGSPAQATREAGPRAFWSVPLDELLATTATGAAGLPAEEAARRLARDGPNTVEVAHAHRGLRLLLAQFTSPIVLILVAATILAMALGDLADGLIILVIIAASGALGFWQEHTAGQAVDALMARVRVEVEVRRGGRELSLPVEEVVVGDLLVLNAGDVVPADCRLTTSQELLVDEAALTGESYPVEKRPGVVAADAPLGSRANSLFMGTHVVSGTGEAVVAGTGRSTEFGGVSARLAAGRARTGFERGITAFGLLLVRAMVALVVAIFVVNLVLHRPLVESLLFSLALAVGLTPQLLPAVVSISLSTGARRMAAEQVIVKRLDAIEDFGAMTVLCTDKTGTITAGAIHLDRALDPAGRPSQEVLWLARLNAGLQRGFPTPWTRRSWTAQHRTTAACGSARSPTTSSASGSASWSAATASGCWSPRAPSTRCSACAPPPRSTAAPCPSPRSATSWSGASPSSAAAATACSRSPASRWPRATWPGRRTRPG